MFAAAELLGHGVHLPAQVVAPVRETAAQALGAATRPLPPPALRALLASLRQLSECGEWEVRHGGLLGLKYVLAARGGGDGVGGPGVDGDLLQAVLPAALVGLRVSVGRRRSLGKAQSSGCFMAVQGCSSAWCWGASFLLLLPC